MKLFPLKLLVSWCFLCFSVQCAELRSGNGQREVLVSSCRGCGFLRNRMRKIKANGSCINSCRFFLGSRRLSSGWECGTCEEWNDSNKRSNAPSSAPSSAPTSEPAYVVTLDLENVTDASLKTIISDEAAKWSKVITADVPDIAIRRTSFFCAPRAIPSLIDDILICVNVKPIDGPGKVLGFAGSEYMRNDSMIPILGGMTFDVDDADSLVQQGLFDEVILHEMGHVFGISNVIWTARNLTNSGTPPCSYKLESAASREWQAMSGCVGTSVPIENEGGGGAACSHFDEYALTDELMTGYLNDDPPIMSRLTIATLEDIGYEVDYSVAQPFNGVVGSCTRRLQTEAAKREETEDSGRINAIQYGKSFLKQRVQQANAAGNRGPSNVKYIGDQSVSIVYINDAGEVRYVSVNNV